MSTTASISRPAHRRRPRDRAAIANERTRQSSGLELIASENFVSQAILEATGIGLHEQIRRRVSRQALLRRLRVRGRGRDAGHRARESAVRRRARQRAAALGRAGEHGRLHRRAQARRHDPGHEPRARRPPDARPPAELLGQVLQRRAVRRAQGRRAPRLRRARLARPRAQAQAHHRRRQRLSARDRLRARQGRRRRGRRADDDRHGAHRGPGRRRHPSQPRAALRLRHDDDAQDAAGPARRHGAVAGGLRERPRSRGVPRSPGRPAGARHRRQGRLSEGGGTAGLRDLPAADRGQRGAAGHASSRPAAFASSAAAPTTT